MTEVVLLVLVVGAAGQYLTGSYGPSRSGLVYTAPLYAGSYTHVSVRTSTRRYSDYDYDYDYDYVSDYDYDYDYDYVYESPPPRRPLSPYSSPTVPYITTSISPYGPVSYSSVASLPAPAIFASASPYGPVPRSSASVRSYPIVTSTSSSAGSFPVVSAAYSSSPYGPAAVHVSIDIPSTNSYRTSYVSPTPSSGSVNYPQSSRVPPPMPSYASPTPSYSSSVLSSRTSSMANAQPQPPARDTQIAQSSNSFGVPPNPYFTNSGPPNSSPPVPDFSTPFPKTPTPYLAPDFTPGAPFNANPISGAFPSYPSTANLPLNPSFSFGTQATPQFGSVMPPAPNPYLAASSMSADPAALSNSFTPALTLTSSMGFTPQPVSTLPPTTVGPLPPIYVPRTQELPAAMANSASMLPEFPSFASTPSLPAGPPLDTRNSLDYWNSQPLGTPVVAGPQLPMPVATSQTIASQPPVAPSQLRMPMPSQQLMSSSQPPMPMVSSVPMEFFQPPMMSSQPLMPLPASQSRMPVVDPPPPMPTQSRMPVAPQPKASSQPPVPKASSQPQLPMPMAPSQPQPQMQPRPVGGVAPRGTPVVDWALAIPPSPSSPNPSEPDSYNYDFLPMQPSPAPPSDTPVAQWFKFKAKDHPECVRTIGDRVPDSCCEPSAKIQADQQVSFGCQEDTTAGWFSELTCNNGQTALGDDCDAKCGGSCKVLQPASTGECTYTVAAHGFEWVLWVIPDACPASS